MRVPSQTAGQQRLLGLLAWLLAVAPAGLVWLVPQHTTFSFVFNAFILYWCIAPRSLQQHAQAVYEALQQHDLPLARQRVSYLVSRDSEQLSEQQIRMACIESVLENGADAVIAPLFWFMLLGPFGAVFYRFSNTLDAMWGYKNQRYRDFGWAAARGDDLLNLVPARLTAWGYALCAQTLPALKAWQQQADLLDSPNAGPVMTAGAAALGLQLGGPARYHGQLKHKPYFGGSRPAGNQDILRSYWLMYRCLALLIGVYLGISLVV